MTRHSAYAFVAFAIIVSACVFVDRAEAQFGPITPLRVTSEIVVGGLGDDFTRISATGLYQSGSAATWNDYNFEAANLRTGTSTPSYKLIGPSGSLYGLVFIGSGSTTDEVHATIEFLHGWVEQTTAHVHLHWMPTTTDAGTVAVYIDHAWTDAGSTMTAPAQTIAYVAASGVAWKHALTELVEIPGTGHHIGSVLQIRISRNPGQALDTYPGGMNLKSVGVHVLEDTVGSRNETSK